MNGKEFQNRIRNISNNNRMMSSHLLRENVSTTHLNNVTNYQPSTKWKEIKRRGQELAYQKEKIFERHRLLQLDAERQRSERYNALMLKKVQMQNNNIDLINEIKHKERQLVECNVIEVNNSTNENVESNDQEESDELESVVKIQQNNKQDEENLRNEREIVSASRKKAEEDFLVEELLLNNEFKDHQQNMDREKREELGKLHLAEIALNAEREELFELFEKKAIALESLVNRSNSWNNGHLQRKIRDLEREVTIKDQQLTHIHGVNKELHRAVMQMNIRLQQKSAELEILTKNGNPQYIQYGSPQQCNPWEASRNSGQESNWTQPQNHTEQEDLDDMVSQWQKQMSTRIVTGKVISDLRDRYDEMDVWLNDKASACSPETVSWNLSTMRNVIRHYEDLGQRIYEELSPNKYVSTLMLSDKKDLFPNKMGGTLAFGQGDTPQEATENAIQCAYGLIAEKFDSSNNVPTDPDNIDQCVSSSRSTPITTGVENDLTESQENTPRTVSKDIPPEGAFATHLPECRVKKSASYNETSDTTTNDSEFQLDIPSSMSAPKLKQYPSREEK